MDVTYRDAISRLNAEAIGRFGLTRLLTQDPASFAQQVSESSGGYAPYSPAVNSTGYVDYMESLEEGRPLDEHQRWERLIDAAPELSLKPNYILEEADKKHRMGDLLKACYDVYNEKFPGASRGAASKAPGFYEWLDGLPEFERIVMIGNSLRKQGGAPAGSHHNLKPSLVRAFLKGVKYLDQASRRDYRVTFQNGVGHYRGDLFTTFEMRTVFSGPGFGIWVMSPSGEMYAGPHLYGGFHHSSFLAGAPVRSAGEIRANRGKIEFISAKSGHYMPTADHLAWAIETLGTHQVDLTGTRVAVWPRSGGDGRVRLVSAQEFLRNSSQYNAWGTFTRDELGRIQRGEFGGFAG
jgi:hypothetical protein